MSLHIVDKLIQGVCVLDLRGRITLGPETETVRTRVKQALAAGHSRIILDLGEVNYIDSAGLATLVASYTSAQRAGGELKLLRLTKLVRSLMQITRLSTVFEIYDSVDDAVRSFDRKKPAAAEGAP
ncbi:MAG TPA: STAS domain-containing protein [Terriglobia bacterium]|nr:STAS domain-containing protein [Terriglobia bacterium]